MAKILEIWVGDNTIQTALTVLHQEHARLTESLDGSDRKARDHARQIELAWKRLSEARRTASIHIAGWS